MAVCALATNDTTLVLQPTTSIASCSAYVVEDAVTYQSVLSTANIAQTTIEVDASEVSAVFGICFALILAPAGIAYKVKAAKNVIKVI